MKSISVAGNPVSDPLKVISNYIDQRERTIRRFDLMAGTSPYELTPQLIKASRALSSRITKEEEAWLLQIQGDAPWERVSPTDSLIDAEVCSSNGVVRRSNCAVGVFLESPATRGSECETLKSPISHATRMLPHR
jgi:hypothetical protein